MNSHSDGGHAKNAANLDKLNQIISSFGTSYNPANALISLSSMATLQTEALAKLLATDQTYMAWKNATNAREIAFSDLDKFATKLLGGLQSSGAAKQTIDDMSALVRKIRGSEKITKADAGKTAPASRAAEGSVFTASSSPEAVDNSSHSVSQQSYDNKVEHFGKIMQLLKSEILYAPNEADYIVVELQAKHNQLNAANNSVNAAYAAWYAARINRNIFFYHENTGLLDIVKLVKAYVKSLYGAHSQQFVEVNAIPFFRLVSTKDAN